jgi:uncharacterized protein DUF5719
LSDPREPEGTPGGPERDPGPTQGSPGEDRPPALIPSRAARHQPKRRLRGRTAKPPQQPQPDPEPPAKPGPAAPARPEPAAEAAGPRRRIPRPARPAGRPPLDRPEVDRPEQVAAKPTRPRPAIRPPRLPAPRLGGFGGSSVALAGTMVVLAAVLALAANAVPVAKAPAAPAAHDPYSARWVCPLLPDRATSVTLANVGTATANLRTTVRWTGSPSPPANKELAGGATEQLNVKPKQAGKAGYVQVEAFSAPVVVSTPGLGCVPGPGSRWWLPASDTSLGTATKVVIANPDSQPAVVDLVPHLTSGSIRPEGEVFVNPGQAVVKELGDAASAGLKPSVEVVARAGRVVVGAAVTDRGSKQPTFLPAQGTVRPAWSFAGGVSGGGRRAQLLVTNPNSTPLQLSVQVTSTKNTFKPAGRFDEPIANGGTAELDIPPSEVPGPFAVHVRSANGAAFVAALRVSEGDNKTSRIDLGAGQLERGWLVPGATGGGELVLANRTSTELEARLGNLVAGGPGAGQPVRVPPGRVTVRKVPKGVENLLVETGAAGLVAAPVGGGPIVPQSAIGGLPPGGPIVLGPAAAP